MVLDGFGSISHETIYQYLLEDKKDGGELYKYLRHKNKPYRKRYGSSDKRGEIPNKRSIEDRPSIVEEKISRSIYGLCTGTRKYDRWYTKTAFGYFRHFDSAAPDSQTYFKHGG